MDHLLPPLAALPTLHRLICLFAFFVISSIETSIKAKKEEGRRRGGGGRNMVQRRLLQTVPLLGSSLSKSLLLTPPSLQKHLVKGYSESKERNEHVIGERGRSTAEEFSRVAKEKAESVGRTAKETLEGAKEAVVGSTDGKSGKQKENVEKGNHDKMDQA